METIDEYKKRILSYIPEGGDSLTMQRDMPGRLKEILEKVPPEKVDLKPAPGKWSIREIVAHLADDELVGAYRIRLILSAPTTEIQSFDQARWAITGKYAAMDMKLSLSLFTILRQANLYLFSTLTEEQWGLYGIHQERGKESVRDITVYYAGHDINHFKQIEAILETV